MKKLGLFFALLLLVIGIKAQPFWRIDEGFEGTPPYQFDTLGHWEISNTLYAPGGGNKSIRSFIPTVFNTPSYFQLKSKWFSTSGSSKVYLRFNHICKVAATELGRVMYRVEANGTPLTLPFNSSVYFNPPPSSEGMGYLSSQKFTNSSYLIWQGVPAEVPTNSWWKPEIFDISAETANHDSVQIYFRLQYGGTAPPLFYGWLIDNIEVIVDNHEIFPPVIEQLPVVYRDTVEGIGPWTINAKVKDKYSNLTVNHSPIDTVRLIYTASNGANGNILMRKYSGDTLWTGDIPSMQYNTNVTYHICARDSVGNTTCTNDTTFINVRPGPYVTISDSSSSSNQPNPFFQSQSQTKVQFIIKSSELQALNLPAGRLDGLSFYINTPSNATSGGTAAIHGNFFKNFTVKIANTATDATSTMGFTSGLTQVFSAPNGFSTTTHKQGWNKFDFTEDFVWDGISNIIIETCYNNFIYAGGSDFSTNASIRVSNNLGFNASVSAYAQDQVPDLCDEGTNNIAVSNRRPAVRLYYYRLPTTLDAALHKIIEPVYNHTANNINVKVKVRNNGSTSLSNVKLGWSVNNSSQALTTKTFTPPMYQDLISDTITLYSGYNLPNGLNEIKTWAEQPNGGTDVYHPNDTLKVSLYICGGPLAGGTYTVGGTSPDFATLKEVERKLNQCGIAGPVNFNIRPGTYNTNLELRTIAGASVTNTITFKSENDNASSVTIINPTSQNATLFLDSTDFIRVRNITLKANSPLKSNVVYLRGKNQDIQFQNNIFEGLDTNSTSDLYTLVFSNKNSNTKDSAIVFKNNTFKNGSTAIYLSAVNTSVSERVVIDSNIFQNQAYRGVCLNYVNNTSFNKNTFTQKTGSTLSYSGISLSNCKSVGDIKRNSIISEKILYGISIANCTGIANNRMFIANNFIGSKTTDLAGFGINLNTSDTINVFHNTINLNGNAPVSKVLNITSGKVINIRNNILCNNATGFAYYVNTALTDNYLSNYNAIFTNGTNLGYYTSNRLNLAAWKTGSGKDTNSISKNPYFISYDNYEIIDIDFDGKAQPLSSVPFDIAGTTRNVTTPDIGAYEFTSPTKNLEIASIVQPLLASSYCGGTNRAVIIQIRNAGLNTINFVTDSVLFTIYVTGEIPDTLTYTLKTGSLLPAATLNDTLSNSLDLSHEGIYNLKIFSTLPNDVRTTNDTIYSETLDIRKVTNFPYETDFSTTMDPAWKITQLTGTSNWTFVTGGIANPTLTPLFGTGLITQTAVAGSKSRIQTPVMDFTGLNDPYLEFWMSQDNGASTSTLEGVRVKISTDGGLTWNIDSLTFAQRYNGAYSTPGWKLFSKRLIAYANNSCVVIALDVNSQGGRNIAIDKFVIRNLKTNDLRTNVLYTYGKMPINYGAPHTINALVENYGSQKQYNKTVTLSITVANTINPTYVIDSILPFEIKNISFTGINPSNLGVNNVSVSVPADDDNTNNAKVYRMQTIDTVFAYNDTSKVAQNVGNGNGLLLAKYRITGFRAVKGVKAYITGNSTIGKTVYGVVLNAAGIVMDTSYHKVITAADTSKWVYFKFENYHNALVTDTNFYVGIAQMGGGYNPLGSQAEYPVRSSSFYTAASLTGGAYTQVTTKGRFMIEAHIGAMPLYQPKIMYAKNPVSGCGIDNQPVKIRIRNNGIATIPAGTIQAWYRANGAPIGPQLVNIAIPSNTDTLWSFAPWNFVASMADSTWNLKIWINHPQDDINVDDTIQNYSFVSKLVPTIPEVQNPNPFDTTYGSNVEMAAKILNPFIGQVNWYTTPTSITKINIGDDYQLDSIRTCDTVFYVSSQRVENSILGCESARIPINIHVVPCPTQDLSPRSVTAPTSKCNLRNENIKVSVKNYFKNTAPADSSYIYYQVNGGPIVKDTINVAIVQNQTINFTFSQPYDFSAPLGDVTYNIKIWTSITGDIFKQNDTLKYTIVSGFTAVPYSPTNINVNYGDKYTFNSNNVMYIYPNKNITTTTPLAVDTTFTTPYLYDTATYWVNSRAISSTIHLNELLGNGTVISDSLPFVRTSNYSWSAMIYRKTELTQMMIDTIGFINKRDSLYNMSSQRIYMGFTTDTVFKAANTKPNPSAMTKVYDGEILWTDSVNFIPLQKRFPYDGEKNLLIYWENDFGSYDYNDAPSLLCTNKDTMCMFANSDNSLLEAYSSSIRRVKTRPNIRFIGNLLSCPTDTVRVNLNTINTPQYDVGVTRLVSPLGGSAGYYTTPQRIKVTVKNFGTSPVSYIPVHYIYNDVVFSNIITNTIASLDSLQYTFTNTIDLSENYMIIPIKAYTGLSTDNFHNNDTINANIYPPAYCASYALLANKHEDIGNVQFAGINNGFITQMYYNPNAINGYTDYTQTVTPSYVVKGGIYPFSATQFTINTATGIQGKVRVYIDYDHSASFSPSEEVLTLTSPASGNSNLTFPQTTASGSIMISPTAKSGPTRMRIVLDQNSLAPSCGTYNYGETEDYTIIIRPKITVDAALTNFDKPNSHINKEGQSQEIKVRLMNTGTTALTNATIKYQFNNNPLEIINWSGNLASGASALVSIDTLPLPALISNIIAYVDVIGDTIHNNDTIRYKLYAQPKIDIRPITILNPTALSCSNNNDLITVRIGNFGYDTVFFNINNLQVTAQVSISNNSLYSNVINTGFLAPGAQMDYVITQNGNFAIGGDYAIKVFTSCSQDGNIFNDTIYSDTLNLPSAIPLPYSEDFESFEVGTGPFPNLWTQSTYSITNKKYVWRANIGQTLSGTTSGPPYGNIGGEIGKYMYAYGAAGAENDQTYLVSNCINTNGVVGQENRISFYYYMFSPGTNSKLFIEYGTGSNWVTLDSIVGQQQTSQSNAWNQKIVSYEADNKNWRLRFRAKRGSTKGDIAIDDINFIKLIPDVGIEAILNPGPYLNNEPGSDSTITWSQDTVKVTVKNYGQLPITNIPIAYKVEGLPEVEELLNVTIQPGASIDYTFNTTYAVPNIMVYQLCAYTKRGIDGDTNNNWKCRNLLSVVIGIDDFSAIDGMALGQNIPNPAGDKTTIKFFIPQDGLVTLQIADMLGQNIVKYNIDGKEGENTYEFSTNSLAPGMYNYWINYKGNRLLKKMSIIR